MPPDDPTPLGDAMTHRFPEQKFPEPKPGAHDRPQDADVADRPPLPDHRQPPSKQKG